MQFFSSIHWNNLSMTSQHVRSFLSLKFIFKNFHLQSLWTFKNLWLTHKKGQLVYRSFYIPWKISNMATSWLRQQGFLSPQIPWIANCWWFLFSNTLINLPRVFFVWSGHVAQCANYGKNKKQNSCLQIRGGEHHHIWPPTLHLVQLAAHRS